MLYIENGQFKTTYRADQAIFPIAQDRIAIGLLLALAIVVMPLVAPEYLFRAILIPFLILALAAVGGVAGLAAAWFFHCALVQMMAQADSRFQLSFALDPLVSFIQRRTRARRALAIGIAYLLVLLGIWLYTEFSWWWWRVRWKMESAIPWSMRRRIFLPPPGARRRGR